MTHVHYKFSSKLSYDTVVFDGPHITLKDLKRQIMSREKLTAGDCDLQITNAQNKEEYTDDEGLIPKGSSVIVRRIPIIGGKSSSNSKTRNIERSDAQLHHAFGAFKAMDDQNSSRALPLFSKMVNLADADVSEEDKLKVLMNQSAYDPINYSKKFSNVLPANYTCYRCGNTGHHIKNCPSSGDKNFEAPVRIKKSTGIPRSFMVEVDDPSIKGAMLTNCGRYAIPAIDAEAYAIGKKERPPFVPQEQPSSEEEEDPIPGELLCVICHDLMSDAVVIPCCGNSYCDDCIRTTLLDSEDHICPSCSQSDVSPDTLIANRFLRQAVDNFKKERGCAKSLKKGCSASKSQNPTPAPSPVPTPPPLTVQQPQKPHLPTHSQQDPLLYHSRAADTPPSPQMSGASLSATGPASAPNTLSTSLEPVQSHLETPDKEAEEKTPDDSAAAAPSAPSVPSVPVSPKDPTDAPSQLIPLVNLTPVAEQPQTASVNLPQPSSGPTQRPSEPSTSWDSSSSSSRCPTGGWNESNTQQHPPSTSSYPATPPPPLFPSPHFHTFLAAQQPLGSYPPGYPPPTPVWTLPNLQGAPIPSLCPSTSIPALIPKEWYRHQRKKKERSPHRGSSYRRSSSRSNSKSSKSKSSRSYSRSSSRSRSRSRSRSKGRSRPHSPYSRQRDLHTRSQSSHPYSYGYKRPPTPSSSSSPGAGYQSRSKSPSDQRKNSSSSHSRHHYKKSSWSSSRKRGESSQGEAGGLEGSLPPYLYAQHASQSRSLELDRDRYLQWKREYKEWCDKYFSSYVGHFHQLPLPLLNLPPPPQWGYGEGSGNHSHASSDSRHQGRRRMDGRSPPSQSSSDSRSPPSQSSRDSHSTASQSSSDSRSTPSKSTIDSRSSPSHSSNDSRSPPSQSSSDGRSTPFEDGAEPRPYQQRCTERHSRLPITLTRSSKEAELQEDVKNLQNLSTLKHEQKIMKKHEEGRGEESSSLDVSDSTNECRKHKRTRNTGPNACKDISPARDEATASDALESAQPLTKLDKHLDKVDKRQSREQRSLEKGKRWRKDKHSESRHDAGRRHKERSNDESGRVDTDRYSYPGASRASDSRSEKNRKRKGEDIESNKCLNTENAEDPKTRKSESPNPFERKKPKMEKKQERKTWPPTERDIWEGGIKVKPQKKISININLEGKRKEDKIEKQDLSYLESDARKTKEDEAGNGEEENKLNKGIEAIEKKESSRDMDGVSEEKIKPDEGETRQKWEKATFRDDKGEAFEKIAGEKNVRENEDFALYHSAFRGVEEEKDGKKWDERDGMEVGKGEEVTNDEKRFVWGGIAGQAKPQEELMEGMKWRIWTKGDTVRSKSPGSRDESHHDGPNTAVDDGSSYEDHQERKPVVKTLEEYTQDRVVVQEDKLVLIQVPRSKWEKEESEEEEHNEAAIKVQTDALAVFLPSPSVSVTAETATNRETETDEKRERSGEMERDESRTRERGRDKEREMTPISSTSNRSVAPSSGKDRSDSDLCTDRDGKRRMEMERQRDRERRRDRERSRDRQKESKRSKESTRKEEKGRDRERESRHSSSASAQKRNPSSSSHSYSASHSTERRDRQRGGRSSSCHGGRSSTMSRATELPDQNTHRSYRDTSLDLKFKDHHQDPSGRNRHKDRPAGTYHSPPSLSYSQDKEKGPLPSGSELGKPRMSSPGQELMSEKGREKGEWKLRQGKGERKYQVVVAERDGGEADELDGLMKWEGGKELEDGERPSSSSNSVSSSAGQENGSDDARKEKKKKHKKHKEKRHAAPEQQEERELKKQKHKKETSKTSRHGGEESSGEMDDTKLCFPVMLS